MRGSPIVSSRDANPEQLAYPSLPQTVDITEKEELMCVFIQASIIYLEELFVPGNGVLITADREMIHHVLPTAFHYSYTGRNCVCVCVCVFHLKSRFNTFHNLEQT